MIKAGVPKSVSLLIVLTIAPVTVHAELSASVEALAKTCAPDVSPKTISYLVAHESRNNQYAINVNTKDWDGKRNPSSRQEALRLIKELEEKGLNYDIGYGQINSENFEWLGVTAESLLDSCNNLRASSAVLMDCYKRSIKDHGEGQQALRHALSCYNTGSQTKGFENGYVAKVVAHAGPQIPALLGDSGSEMASTETPEEKSQGAVYSGAPDAFYESTGDAFTDSTPDAFQAAQEIRSED